MEKPIYWGGRYWTSAQWRAYEDAVKRSGLDEVVTQEDRDWLAKRNKCLPISITVKDKTWVEKL